MLRKVFLSACVIMCLGASSLYCEEPPSIGSEELSEEDMKIICQEEYDGCLKLCEDDKECKLNCKDALPEDCIEYLPYIKMIN